MGRDVPFPYPYGSDLHRLWGWAHRIDLMLSRPGYMPGSCDWMIFRPCIGAADAMMRYSIDYGSLIAELREHLANVEEAFAELASDASERSEFIFVDRTDVLESRIKKACELIAEREDIPVNPACTVDHDELDDFLGMPRTRRDVKWDHPDHDDTVIECTAEPPGPKRNSKWTKVHALLDNEKNVDDWDDAKRQLIVSTWNRDYGVGLTVSKLGELIRGRRKRPKNED